MIGPIITTTFFNLTAYLLILLILQYFCCAHLNLTNRNLLICILIAIFSMVITQFFCSEIISTNIILVVLLGTILFLSRKRIIDLLLSIFAFLLYMTFCIFPLSLIETLFPNLDHTISPFGITYSGIGLVIDSSTLILLFGIRYITQKYTYQPKLSVKELLLSALLPLFSLMTVTIVFISENTLLPANLFWNISMTLLFIAGYVYYFYTLIDSRLRAHREVLARTQTAYLNTQLDSLQHLQEKEKDVQKLRHDLKNHISVIETLCAQGNYNKVLDYTKKLNCSYLTNTQPLSGNAIADTIIHSKKKIAEKANITFTFTGNLSGLNTISDPDICGLLANAYDNAIEACISQEHAYIHTKANSTKNHTFIEIRNSISKKVKIHHNCLKTTKEDKYNHGYGIEIMKQIAHKYHGSCNITSSQTEFIATIILITTNHS